MPKILLIDDSRVTRRMLQSAIGHAGYDDCEFLHAGNGKEAFEVLESENYRLDLAFCDVCMPEMDGLSFLTELSERCPDRSFPVVMLTGDSRKVQADEARQRGAHEVMQKPFRVEILSEVLKDVLPEAQRG